MRRDENIMNFKCLVLLEYVLQSAAETLLYHSYLGTNSPQNTQIGVSNFVNENIEGLAQSNNITSSTNQSITFPSNLDWRDKGAVTKVEFQDSCFACWAFASVSAIESHYFIKTGNLIPLSAQNLIDCSNVFGNKGCTKGYPAKTFKYIIANKGLNYARTYPFRMRANKCQFDRKAPTVSIRGYVKIKKYSEESLLQAVATKGPVVVALYTNEDFRDYEGGVFYDPDCKCEHTDHVMLVVGYGTDSDDGDYWILKNSWGKAWGEDGYMRLARNRNNTCGVASFAIYPLV